MFEEFSDNTKKLGTTKISQDRARNDIKDKSFNYLDHISDLVLSEKKLFILRENSLRKKISKFQCKKIHLKELKAKLKLIKNKFKEKIDEYFFNILQKRNIQAINSDGLVLKYQENQEKIIKLKEKLNNHHYKDKKNRTHEDKVALMSVLTAIKVINYANSKIFSLVQETNKSKSFSKEFSKPTINEKTVDAKEFIKFSTQQSQNKARTLEL